MQYSAQELEIQDDIYNLLQEIKSSQKAEV